MTGVLIAVMAAALAVAGAIGYLTVAGAEQAHRTERTRHTPRQLARVGDNQWAPVCRTCGTQGKAITTNNTSAAFAWLDQWDHACDPTPTDPNQWRHQ